MDDVRIYNRVLSPSEVADLAAGRHTAATWVGGTSNNFETAANWDTGAVPDPYTRIIIPNTTSRPAFTTNESGASLAIDANASLDLSSYNLTLNDSGTFTNAGTLLLNGGNTLANFTNDTSHGGAVTYTGSGTYASLAAGNSYYNLTFNGPGGSWSATANVTAAGSVVVTAGNYSANGKTTTVTGVTRVMGGTYQGSTATQTFNGGLMIGGGTYTGSTGAANINGMFTLTGGVLTAPSSSMMISGDWFRFGGTFTANGGTVSLDGTNQTMTGSTTFYDLTKSVSAAATLTFAATTTQTITHTLTLTGVGGNLLSLRSSHTGSQWKVDPQGSRVISYLDVKDSNNVNGTAIVASGDNSTDSGNNTNWTFVVSTTTALTSGTNPTTYGQATTLTATVTPSTATGTLTFKDGSTTLGTATVGHGSGSLVVSALAVGSHSLTAAYGGNSSFSTSTSNTVTQTVNQATSSTVLASSANPSSFGNSITLTGTVSPSSATGTLTFKDGSTTLGTATIGHGSGSFLTSGLAVGSHSLTVVYGGNTNYTAGTSNTVTQAVNQATSTTVLTSGTNPTTFGGSTKLTGTVSPSSATGTLTFKDGSTTIGTITLGHGSGSLALSSLSAGSHSLTVVYGGNINYSGSTSNTVTQTVNKATTSTALASGTNPSTFGASVTFTATVTPSTATGTLTFKDGSTTLGTATIGHGSGSYTTSALSVATHSITAVYGGDSNHLTSTSSALSQVVNKASTSLALASGTNPSTYGGAVVFAATVTPSGATGTVTFSSGSTTLGTVTLGHGSGSLAVSSLVAGANAITAAYGGDSSYLSSTSNTVTQTVNQDSTATSLISDTNPSTFGASVRFTGTVTPSTAIGTFAFKDGSTTIGTATVGHGSGSYVTSTLGVATHAITAVYSGAANYITSTSNTVTQTVHQATSTPVLISSSNPSTFGGAVTLTASVTPSAATGTITFKDGSATLGTATIGHGSGSLATSSLGVGSHSLMAVYGGNTNYSTSTSNTVTQAVNKAATTTALTSSLNPSQTTDAVVLTAALTPSDATGALTFKDAVTTIGTVMLRHGSGSITVPSFTEGSHPLTAIYSGNADYLDSTGSTLTQRVSAPASSAASSSGGSPAAAPSPGGTRGSTTQIRIQEAIRTILARYNQQLQAGQGAIAQHAVSSSSAAGAIAQGAASSSRPQIARGKPSTASGTVIAEKRGHLAIIGTGTLLVYRDVPTDAWFAPYVSTLITDHIAEGYKDDQGKLTGEFGVADAVTYAEVLKMALEASGKSPRGSSPRNLSARNTWAAPYVKEAETENLSVFVPTLDVNTPATRGAVIQTIMEVLGITIGKTPSTFSDVPPTNPYTNAISAAAFFGLVQGDTDAQGHPTYTFRPDAPMNRAEVAKIIALAREVTKH